MKKRENARRTTSKVEPKKLHLNRESIRDLTAKGDRVKGGRYTVRGCD
jgi:hypothetical protein